MDAEAALPADEAAELWSKLMRATISATGARQLVSDGLGQVIDVRAERDFLAAHVPSSVHLPPDSMDEATCAHFLVDDKLVLVLGATAWDAAALQGAQQLSRLGRQCKIVLGGMFAWREQELPIDGLAR